MAKRPKLTKAELSAFRSDIKRLRDKGLVRASVDLRKVKPTKHYKRVVKENRDVLQGESFVLKVWGGLRSLFGAGSETRAQHIKNEASLPKGARVKGNRIIIPNKQHAQFTYSKKTGKIIKKRVVDGHVTKEVLNLNMQETEQIFKRFDRRIYVGSGNTRTFGSYSAYLEYMATYNIAPGEAVRHMRAGEWVRKPKHRRDPDDTEDDE